MNKEIFNQVRKNLDRKSLSFMAIMNMVEEVAEEWGEYIIFSPARSTHEINGSKPIFEDFNTNMVITENGKIYKVKAETYKTGNIVWNDDVYLDEIGTRYLDHHLIGALEIYPTLSSREEITLEDIENAASEIVSNICQ